MVNFNEFTGENTHGHSLHWPHIPYHPYRILIGGSR